MAGEIQSAVVPRSTRQCLGSPYERYARPLCCCEQLSAGVLSIPVIAIYASGPLRHASVTRRTSEYACESSPPVGRSAFVFDQLVIAPPAPSEWLPVFLGSPALARQERVGNH